MSRHHQFNKELDDFLEDDGFQDFSDDELEKLSRASAKVKDRLKDISYVKQKDIHNALINNSFDVEKACLWITKQKQLKNTSKSFKTLTPEKGLISLNETSLNENISEEVQSNSKVCKKEYPLETSKVSIPKQSKLSALANSKHKLSSNISTISSLKSVSLLSHLTKTKFNIIDDTKNNRNESKAVLNQSTHFINYSIESEKQDVLKKTIFDETFQKKEINDESLNKFFKSYEYNIEFANQRFSLFTGVLDNDLKSAFHETSSNSSKSQRKNLRTSKITKSTIHSEFPSDNDNLSHELSIMNISSVSEHKNMTNFNECEISLTKTPDLKIIDDKKKDNINIIVIGHADAGKSTLVGRLLYDLKVVDIKTIEKLKLEANKSGKSSFHFAWVLDQTLEERDRGVTMDIGINYFETLSRKYTILDAPGHKDFIPNMIAGAAEADLALLVIDASSGSFESGFMVHGQTREHIILVRSLGIQKIVVAINKLETINWSQERYEEIKAQLLQFFIYKGFQKFNISFIPCSGLNGENLIKITPLNTQLQSWYSGCTLLDSLESISIEHQRFDAPLRLSIMDIYKSSNTLTSIFGKIETGTLQVGKSVIIMPSKEKGEVKSIYVHNNIQNIAFSGDSVLVNLLNIDSSYLKSGDIICDFENPIQIVLKFRARIVTFELSRPLIIGSPLVIHRGRLNVDANIKKLIAIIDKSTGEIKKKEPRLIGSFTAAIVEIEFCKQPEPMETFKNCKELGRFIARSQGETIAAGIIEDG
ncbi:unnamed protein product [Pneumocystis jirovecii]|uniref:Elongation factor 1 alpha-like protein n=1 Tax=Pneumocystis jirovecii TaxID=42068 RepID=L0PFD9_PNEJI|nr:unnamed protein product [Pneumocystis jirovecii]